MEQAFGRLDYSIQALSEEELDWKCCPEANTIRNILVHIIVEWYERDGRTFSGNIDLKEVFIPESLSEPSKLSLGSLLSLLEEGKDFMRTKMNEISSSVLLDEIDWFLGVRTRESYLVHGIGEVFHHEGQIAATRGLYKRKNANKQ